MNIRCIVGRRLEGSDYERIGATRGSTVFRDPVSGLSPGVEYYYRVKAVDSKGSLGGWGPGSNFAVAIYTPPPSGLSAVVSAGSVVVSWTAPPGHPAEYVVFRRVAFEGDEYERIGTTRATVYRDRVSGLSPGFEYYYRVKAVDRKGSLAGWGSGSNYAAVTTPAPSGLSATINDGNYVVFSWTAPGWGCV